eukprot:353839-Chlamydomonas_euryale.AAC.42
MHACTDHHAWLPHLILWDKRAQARQSRDEEHDGDRAWQARQFSQHTPPCYLQRVVLLCRRHALTASRIAGWSCPLRQQRGADSQTRVGALLAHCSASAVRGANAANAAASVGRWGVADFWRGRLSAIRIPSACASPGSGMACRGSGEGRFAGGRRLPIGQGHPCILRARMTSLPDSDSYILSRNRGAKRGFHYHAPARGTQHVVSSHAIRGVPPPRILHVSPPCAWRPHQHPFASAPTHVHLSPAV